VTEPCSDVEVDEEGAAASRERDRVVRGLGEDELEDELEDVDVEDTPRGLKTGASEEDDEDGGNITPVSRLPVLVAEVEGICSEVSNMPLLMRPDRRPPAVGVGVVDMSSSMVVSGANPEELSTLCRKDLKMSSEGTPPFDISIA